MLTIEQKLARNEAERKRLMAKKNSLETGQKIVIGGLMLSIVKDNPERAKQLLDDINQNVTRKADLERLKGIIEEISM